MIIKLTLPAVILGALLAIGSAAAQSVDYPTKPIRIINTTPAGGGTDLTLRVFADRMSKELGQQVVVENKPGAGGTIASLAVATASPDGYTLLGTFDAHATNPSFLDNLPYDTLKDFRPISQLAAITMMIAVAPSVPAHNSSELVALAKARPGEVTYASIGKGSAQYIIAELFADQAGLNLKHISYKERSAMTTDVLAGRVSIIISSIAGIQQYIDAGTLRGIGLTQARRSSVLPNLPTFKEQGLPAVDFISWVGLFAPANTPREIVDRLNAAVRKVATQPDLKEQIAKAGGEVAVSSPEQFDAMIRNHMQTFANLAKKVNTKPQ